MKKLGWLFLTLLVVFPIVLLAQETTTETDKVVDGIAVAVPILKTIFIWLGAIVVAGITIDGIIPDKYDKGFMGLLLKIPFLGTILKSIARFSPFNINSNKYQK